MSHNLACCYLTYNHPKTMEHVLTTAISSYKQWGIDIYIYDSSEDDKTETVVKKLQEEGYDNIYYVDVRFIKNGDDKYLYVIQGKGLEHHYDYILPIKDRSFYQGKTLENIVKATGEEYDVIMIADEYDRWEARWPKVRELYTDPAEFFGHYGALSTDWLSVIRRLDTMVDTVDWDNFIKTYELGAGNYFNQTVTTFARLAELDNPIIKVVPVHEGERLSSMHSTSGWVSHFMEVWGDRWIKAIYSLPDIYNGYKLSVIKSQLGLPALFGSTDTIVYLRNEGLFTKDMLESLTSMWPMITDYPLEYAMLIMDLREQEVYEDVGASFVQAFLDHDYDRAYYLFQSNNWLIQVVGNENYKDLDTCFRIYRGEINKNGYSVLTHQIDSWEDLLVKFRAIRDRNKQ